MIQRKKRNASRISSRVRVPNVLWNQLPIVLPRPSRDGGISVTQALQKRKTTREIRDKKLSMQLLSDLLWAACGINRKKGPFGTPGRTAASASNSKEIDVYVALEEGVYLYNAIHHRLIPIAADDIRVLSIGPGQANFIVDAPVHLIYVVDINKLTNSSGYEEPGLKDPEIQKSYYFADTGLIAGNVYLFAASRGLAAWFHNCNKENLPAKLKLRSDQRPLFGQTVGYPVKRKKDKERD